MELPILYRQSKSGKIRQWRVWTEGSQIWTEYGLVGGKLQQDYKEAEAKNVGRSNETTPEEQAEKEAQALWTKKVDRKYSETIEEAKEPDYFPMLAKSFNQDKITYPCDVQRKLDGVRCLAYWEDGQIKLMSRGGKFYDTCSHIAEELAEILPKGDYILDGEIYLHGETFQQVTKLVKKYREDETEELDYYVYDIVSKSNADNPWRNRKQGLRALLHGRRGLENIKLVQTESVNTLEEIMEHHSLYVEQGYEGAMVRLHDSPYTFNHRSNGLFKVKSFQDEEFEIVDYVEGEGRLRGCVIWKCETEDGSRFEVKQKGSLDSLKEMYNEADQYIGKLLKVKFFGHTEAGLPRFPVGLGIRLEEDLDPQT